MHGLRHHTTECGRAYQIEVVGVFPHKGAGDMTFVATGILQPLDDLPSRICSVSDIELPHGLLRFAVTQLERPHCRLVSLFRADREWCATRRPGLVQIHPETVVARRRLLCKVDVLDWRTAGVVLAIDVQDTTTDSLPVVRNLFSAGQCAVLRKHIQTQQHRGKKTNGPNL